MADGSIRVETKLDTDGVEAGLDDVEKMCEDTKKQLEKVGKELNIEAKVSLDTSAAEKACDNTKAEFEKIAEALNFKVKPVSITSESGLNKAQKKLADIQAEIERIQAEKDNMLKNAATDEQAAHVLEMEAEETKKLTAEQNELNRAIDEYKKKKAEAAAIKQAKATEKQYKSDVKGVNTDVGTSLVGDDFLSKINTAEEYEAALARVKGRMTQIEAETSKIAAAKGINPADALRANTEYQKLKSKLEALTNTTKTFKKTSQDSFETARKSADHMGDGIKKAIATMSKYTIAIFGARSAFYAIKSAIGSAVSENEKLNNTVTAMKGVLAHALSPAIERVVYYIQYGLAYLNLFIKTLTGVDLVAQYNAKALKKQAEATKETAKATKDAKNQLAGFDEKNMLTSPSDNTAKKENPAATLDLPDVSGGKFEQICETIKKNLGDILAFAGGVMIAVGFVLLVCGQIPMGIAAILAGIALTAAAIGNSDAMTDKVGTLINTIMLIVGGAFLALGLMLCTTPAFKLGIALVAIGAALLVSAMAVKTKELPDETQKMILLIMGIAGAAMLALGVILCLTTAMIPLGIALIAVGAALLATAVVMAVNKLPDDIRTFIMVITAIASAAMLVLGIILCATGVHVTLGVALIAAGVAGLVTVASLNKDVIKNWVSDAWNSVKNFWNTHIGKYFTKQWWMSQLDAIPDGVKAAINTAISFVERGVNWIVGKINSISFTVPSWVPGIGGSVVGFNLPYVSIPRLARGGIVNNPGRGQHIIAGEAGAEAVLPLETNTEWMNILAEKIAERISIPIVNKFYVDSKEVATSYNKNQERFTFATNGGVL
ncbi:MAG: hypothetical protein U0K91_05765 [Acutalibacteraceae bacterium]|nr:hypothetical protein [Acutalibacteraceae bacterium]